MGSRGTILKGTVLNPKGRGHVPGKFTTLKNAFIGAFKDIGGQQAIVDWINETVTVPGKKGKKAIVISFAGDRKEAFFKMITRMLPTEVKVGGEVPVTPTNFNDIPDEQIDKMIARLEQVKKDKCKKPLER